MSGCAALLLVKVVLFDNGVQHTQERTKAKNHLVRLGKILRTKINDRQTDSLKDIASRIPEFKDFKLCDIDSAQLEPGELIFLSDSKPPTINDIYLSYIFYKTDEIFEAIILSKNSRVLTFFGDPSRFQKWLAEVDTHKYTRDQEIENFFKAMDDEDDCQSACMFPPNPPEAPSSAADPDSSTTAPLTPID